MDKVFSWVHQQQKHRNLLICLIGFMQTQSPIVGKQKMKTENIIFQSILKKMEIVHPVETG